MADEHTDERPAGPPTATSPTATSPTAGPQTAGPPTIGPGPVGDPGDEAGGGPGARPGTEAGGEADAGPYTGLDAGPDSTAERVALWRAMHVQVDSPPHVLADEIGLRLAAPAEDWRERPDMDPEFTRGFRAAIVSRARFVEDLVAEEADHGVTQYVILGAGLDTFAQRRPETADRLRIFEVDRPGPQAWKRRRLAELGFGVPDRLRLVPVDFEQTPSWSRELAAAGFDPGRPAVVVSTGVSMYLTRDATAATLRQAAALAPGSTFALTFQLTAELIADPADRAVRAATLRNAQASGTPFISFYTPREMVALAREAGFAGARHVSGAALADRYFADRADGLRPANGEDFLLATT
jgi:methyltransferase (TIGR00027 family)